MNFKKFAAAVAATAVVAAMPMSVFAYDASGDDPVELVFTSVSVSGDSHTTAMTAFADAVEELSGGSVTCKVYSDGTLFTSENELDAVLQGSEIGGADLAYISFPTLSTQAGLEWCAMVNSAYFWSNYDHMTNTLNGEIGQEIFGKISENVNLTPLCAMYLGSRVINTRDKEINSYADMDGVLIRMPGSDAWQNLGSALGGNPTPIAFSELYTALSNGACDAQDNPLPSDISAKFYEVAPYFAITNHVVDSILPCICTDTWNAMTEDQQQAVIEAMQVAKEVNDTERIALEESCVETLLGEGCTVTYPDINEFKEKAQEYYEAHPEQTGDWDMDLYSRIQEAAN